MLRFAFDELNLFRLSAFIAEYNPAGLSLAKKFGFIEEVRRRQALERDGRRWDMIHCGLLREEWLANLAFTQNQPSEG
jgi:RimJ/RimL family protein N-acetyltransferase